MKLTDFSYVMPTENQAKRRIVLAGMMDDGPLAQGFSLNTEKHPKDLLGDNALTRCYDFLINGGVAPKNIIFYRINGRHSRLILTKNDQAFFQLVSIGASDQDNNIQMTVSQEGITLFSNYSYQSEEETSLSEAVIAARQKTRPDFKKTYLFEDYPYLSELAAGINQDAGLGIVDVAARETKQGITKDYFSETGEYLLSEGTSESNLTTTGLDVSGQYPEDYWRQFHQYVLGKEFDGMSYSNLMEIEAELLYFPDIPVEEAPEVALFAARIAEQKTREQGILCSALFRVSRVPGQKEIGDNEYFVSETHYFDSELQAEVEYKTWEERDAFLNRLETLFTEEDRTYDYMKNLQIVVGSDKDNEGVIRPGSHHYALLLLTSPFYLSLSNKELSLFTKLNTEIPKSLVASLQAKGYICIVPSVRRKAVFVSVQDMAGDTSSLLKNHYNKRLLTYIADDIEELLENYIGNTKSYYSSSSVLKLLNDYLEQYKANDIIQSYYVENVASSYLETAEINVSLYFYNEVTSVRNRIMVSKEGWEVDLWNNLGNAIVSE